MGDLAPSNFYSETFIQNSPLVAEENLVLWYLFDEGNLSQIYDFSGNQNHGTLQGGSFVQGNFQIVLNWKPMITLLPMVSGFLLPSHSPYPCGRKYWMTPQEF